MSRQANQMQDRREFFRSALRYLTLAGLVSMSGLLWARRRSAAVEQCINPGIYGCRGCPVLPTCTLSAAMAEAGTTESDRDAG